VKANFHKVVIWLFVTTVLAAAGFGFGQDLPDGEGKALLENNCSFCHSMERLQGKNYGKQYWEDVIAEMREKGSPLSEEDVPSLVSYLVKTFGAGPEAEAKAAEARKLIQTNCTGCHGMDRIEEKRLDKAGWERTVKGMIASGAQLSEAEAGTVIEYLANTYPAAP